MCDWIDVLAWFGLGLGFELGLGDIPMTILKNNHSIVAMSSGP